MKGGAHIGAIKALQEVQGSLEFPDGIYGFSVGAIVGTAVAFNVKLEVIETVWKKYCKLSNWIPTPSVSHALSFFERKGFFTMDLLRTSLIEMYTEAGIPDIETKRICDAPQPLFIVASNMSTQRPTILTGKVPLLEALLCSCCLPGVFEPRVLYGDVYLDAAVYVRSIEQIISPPTLILNLGGRRERITPESSLGDILFACYVGRKTGVDESHHCRFMLNVRLLDDLSPEGLETLCNDGYVQTLAFLAKRRSKEGE
jgi:hypothetical protein